MKVKVAQCLTLCNPMDYGPWDSPGQNTGVGSLSVLQGIFPSQGLNLSLLPCMWIPYQLSYKGSLRTLEWVAIHSPVDLFHSGIEPGSPALQADSLPTELLGRVSLDMTIFYSLFLQNICWYFPKFSCMTTGEWSKIRRLILKQCYLIYRIKILS